MARILHATILFTLILAAAVLFTAVLATPVLATPVVATAVSDSLEAGAATAPPAAAEEENTAAKSGATGTPAKDASTAASSSEIESLLASVDEEILSAKALVAAAAEASRAAAIADGADPDETAPAATNPNPGSPAGRRLAQLQRIRTLILQRQSLEADLAVERAERLRHATELKELRTVGVPTPPPYPLEELDQVRLQRNKGKRTRAELSVTIEAAEASLRQAEKLREKREAERRLAEERAARESSAEKRILLDQQVAVLRLDARIATRQAEVRRAELDLEELRLATHSLRMETLAERETQLREGLRFTEEELKEYTDRLDELTGEWNGTLEILRQRLADQEREVLGTESGREAAAGTIQAHQVLVQATRTQIQLVERRLELLTGMREAWQRRFETAQGLVESAQIIEWHKETVEKLEQIGRDALLLRSRLLDVERSGLALQEAAAEENNQELYNEPQALKADAWRRLGGAYRLTLKHTSKLEFLLTRLAEELSRRLDRRTISERAQSVWTTVKSVWYYELTSVEDSPITVSKVFVTLFLLTLGFRFARGISHLLGRVVLVRLGVDRSASTALESIVYYVALCAVILIAFRIVNIPLTAFTILGGAFAIGLGFGSQNIVNNFISGLILLIERPISPGDLVEIDGLMGTIDRIGPRSTMVKTFSNTDVVVPNSFILENRFVNHSLSDDVVRHSIVIGVAYGSDARLVEKSLIESTTGVPNIEDWPEPWVRFQDFGDNSLIFELFFYVSPVVQYATAASNIRFRINELFRQRGIEISFPQRDVHLDTASPLQVVVSSAATEGKKD